MEGRWNAAKGAGLVEFFFFFFLGEGVVVVGRIRYVSRFMRRYS